MISKRTKQNLMRELKGNRLAYLGFAMTTVTIAVILFAPIIAPHDPMSQNIQDSLIPPFQTLEYPLGTDALGRDIFSRIVYGARVSFIVGVGSITGAMIIGMAIGLIAGYNGGIIDDILMRTGDIVLTIPSIMIAVVLFGLVGPLTVPVPDPLVKLGLVNNMPETVILPGTIIFALMFVYWITFARVARGEALSVKEQNYVAAAKSLGSGDLHILRKHMFPNAFSPVLVLAMVLIGQAILTESSLAFLGFSGAEVSWGYDISVSRDYLATAWWTAIFPGLAIVWTIIGVNLIGDLFRDAIDPNLENETQEV